MLDRAIHGPWLKGSGRQWEGSQNQVSTLHHVSMLHHVVIVKLDKCMPLWGEPEQVHV